MAFSSEIPKLSAAAWYTAHHSAIAAPPFDYVMLFGCVSAVAVATCYLHRNDSRIAMLALAASLAASGMYGFAEGVWPLGMLETAWAIGAARKGLRSKRWFWSRRSRSPLFAADLGTRHDRYREVFGSN